MATSGLTGIVAARCMDDVDCTQAWATELLEVTSTHAATREYLENRSDQLHALMKGSWVVQASVPGGALLAISADGTMVLP